MKKQIFILAMIAVCVSPLLAQDGQLALLVQKSPEYGGSVTPITGVQMANAKKLVEINAFPSEGYEFVHWLGDVTEPTNRNTTVLVDSPKIVVAVFERAELVTVPTSGAPAAPSSKSGAAVSANPPARFTSGYSPSGSPSSPRRVTKPKPTPVNPVPEPATLAILGVGALIVSRRKRS